MSPRFPLTDHREDQNHRQRSLDFALQRSPTPLVRQKRYDPWCLASGTGYDAEPINASGLLGQGIYGPCDTRARKGDELAPSHGFPPWAENCNISRSHERPIAGVL